MNRQRLWLPVLWSWRFMTPQPNICISAHHRWVELNWSLGEGTLCHTKRDSSNKMSCVWLICFRKLFGFFFFFLQSIAWTEPGLPLARGKKTEALHQFSHPELWPTAMIHLNTAFPSWFASFDMLSAIYKKKQKNFHCFFFNNLFISSPSWFRKVLQITRWGALLMERRMEAVRRQINQNVTRWRRDVVRF